MSQVITVFEATSHLGVAVVKALSRDFDVRAATRDPDGSRATALASPRVTIVYADPDEPKSVEDALRGATGCFIITNTDFESPVAFQKEVTHGTDMAEACSRVGIQHVVFCTQLSVVRTLGMRAQHMDAKAAIEAHINKLNLPHTCIILPIFYEHLLVTPLRPRRVGGNIFELGK